MYLSAFKQFLEIDRTRRFFYLRYCRTNSQVDLNTFLKWRTRAEKAKNIYRVIMEQ